jgi:hypothetical protein
VVVVEGGARTCLRCCLLPDLLYSSDLHPLGTHRTLSIVANKTTVNHKTNIENKHRTIWWY